METKNLIIASFQRALLGMINPAIRAIGVSLSDEKTLKVICYLDRQPEEQDCEDLSDIVGEVTADLNVNKVDESCVYSNENLINHNIHDVWVYLRKE